VTPEQTIHAFLTARVPGVPVYGGQLPAEASAWPAVVWMMATQAPEHVRAPLSRCIIYMSAYGERDDPAAVDALNWGMYVALHGAAGGDVRLCTCVTRGMATIDPDTARPVGRATYEMRLVMAGAEED
jgi:hypothetical protein